MTYNKTTIVPLWHRHSWHDFPVCHLPTYADKATLNHHLQKLSKYPPLVTSWEVDSLREKLVKVEEREAFLLHGGTCAEVFSECYAPYIVNILKMFIQMRLIFMYEMQIPVFCIGRIAGQYAKPRSSMYETIHGEKMLSYHGDLFHHIEATSSKRELDPERMVEGYYHASLTLNFIRSLMNEGFLDIHHPEFWELNFMKKNEYYTEYQDIINQLHQCVSFLESLNKTKQNLDLQTPIYTSHEALNLHYESALTRTVPHHKGYYNLSSHTVWLGNRTRQLDGAHVEFLRGIKNPIGIKVGGDFDNDTICTLLHTLNPNNEKGKIMLITRMGAKEVRKKLSLLIRKVKNAGLNVTWLCDPMHANTYTNNQGIKVRHFDTISEEMVNTLYIHLEEESYLGGLHLEMTGEDVTECLGSHQRLEDHHIAHNYTTYCDPRLNYQQSLELAFHFVDTWKKYFNGQRS